MATITGMTAAHLIELFSAIDDRLSAVEATGSKTWREAIRFLVGGTVDSSTNFPNAYVPKVAGQAISIKEVRARIESGTSIDVQLRRNGSALGSVLNDVTTSAWSVATFTQSLADGDEIDVVLSDPQGTPKDLAVIVVLEHVV